MDFKIADNPVRGNLSPEDLNFFYYDVAKLSELGLLIECYDEEFLELANGVGIELKPLEQQTFSINKYELVENKFIFTILKNKGKTNLSYQTALFNNLRNSFSHYRFSYKIGDKFFLIEDCLSNGYTMRGFVEIGKLKKLIFKLREYSDKQIALQTK